MRMLRALGLSAMAVMISAIVQAPVEAQPATTSPRGQWRDVTFELPTVDWHQITPDPDPKQAGRRLLLERREPLHSVQLEVVSAEAPLALAPSEVAARLLETEKNTIRPDGAFSAWQSSTRSIGGTSYTTLSARFTPTAGPPVVEQTFLVVFPTDYGERQRYLTMRWADAHSATTGAKALDELDGFVAKLAFRELGAMLASDDFSDPVGGALGRVSSTQHYDVAYKEGQLAILPNDPEFTGIFFASLPGNYADTALAVDTHASSAEYGSLAHLWCRRSADGSYRVSVDASDASVHLMRVFGDGDTEELAPWTYSEAIYGGTATNHVELVCRGSLIAIDVNGTRVVTVHDSGVVEGSMAIGAGIFDDADELSEISFANLVVTQR